MNDISLDRVKDIRSEKELSQRELAERSGIPQGTISYIERTGRGNLEQAEALSRATSARMVELSWDSYDAMSQPAVVAGNSYEYPQTAKPAVIEESTEESVSRLGLAREILARVDRVLDIAETIVRR